MSEIGDELYALPPHAFTAARDQRIAEAKQAGDRQLATELGRLKRPSVSAWLANLVGLRLSEDLERLIALGETIRAAQGSVSAAELRELSNQRRRELDAVVGRARELATELDSEPGRQYLAELEGTLAAAMADAGAAAAVRAGRTLKALSYSGFGLPSVAGGTGPAVKVTRPAAPPAPAGSTGAGPDAAADRADASRIAAEQQEAQRQEALARAEAAQARLAEANDVLAATRTAEEEAEQRVRELTARLVAVKESLDDATRDARTARQARITAEREQATAQRRADRSVQ